jgi:S1-C subfamily serine protease
MAKLGSRLAAASLFFGLAGAAVSAEPKAGLNLPASVEVQTVPIGVETRPVSLTRVVSRVSRAKRWATTSTNETCAADGDIAWGDTVDDVLADIERNFGDEVTAAGFRLDGDPENLFEQAGSFGEYTVGGVIKDANGQFCMSPPAGPPRRPGDRQAGRISGKVVLDVEWQIYSRLQRQVVARVSTKGSYVQEKPINGDAGSMAQNAFAEAARGLIGSDAFRKIFIGAPGSGEPVLPDKLAPISLVAGKPAPIGIADAVGSVVLIFAGEGHGSGFLVSKDGYVMTDQHVVGTAGRVKVRWSDGIETLGEVVRTDKARDVALIKTDPRGRQPLSLRTDPLSPGASVYAIGAPLEARFQNTVRRGVVSAYRTIDGFRFLQSDAAINPGDSGGPLLDEKGQVVGLTKSTYRVQDTPTGINFFVPTRDAMDFLQVELR